MDDSAPYNTGNDTGGGGGDTDRAAASDTAAVALGALSAPPVVTTEFDVSEAVGVAISLTAATAEAVGATASVISESASISQDHTQHIRLPTQKTTFKNILSR